jgi:hypothetical protein
VKAPPTEHQVVIVGQWHNDNSGGFSVDCETCRTTVYEPDGELDSGVDDRAPWEVVADAVAAHLAEPVVDQRWRR